jgi:hypothetical protein
MSPEETDRSIIKTQALLPSRNRATMHPGEPLKLIGVEQNENDIRSSTPALKQSDRAVTIVNADENYKRTLAMYDKGAKFGAPLVGRSHPWSTFSDNAPDSARYFATGGRARIQETNSGAPTADQHETSRRDALWPWAFAVCAAGLVAFRFLKRPACAAAPIAAGARRAGPSRVRA